MDQTNTSAQAQINDGGPAFPTQYTDGDERIASVDGMTLRDYFAAKAMQGYLSSFAGLNVPDVPPAQAACMAYDYADAMLAARGGAQ